VAGIDVGGTTISVGFVHSETGALNGFTVEPTLAEEGGEGVTARIVSLVRRAAAEAGLDLGAEVAGIGIGCPGPLDRGSGIVLTTPNLGWADFPVRDLIAGPLGLPAVLDNDANCAAFGEWWLGAGRGSHSLVALTVGTGVGGAIVVNGRVWHGASDAAGEIGHMTINYGGRRCKCGNYGCLEAYASGPNIAARAREGLEAGETSALSGIVDGDLDRLTAAHISEAVLEGDPFATQVLQETARYLGVGLANLINLVNPEIVVVFGGVTSAGEHLLDPLQNEVRRRAFLPAVSACKIVPAERTDDAGVLGAAGLFLRQWQRERAESAPPPASGRDS
jgi:glucokinase